jgi:hypothetical protein
MTESNPADHDHTDYEPMRILVAVPIAVNAYAGKAV